MNLIGQPFCQGVGQVARPFVLQLLDEVLELPRVNACCGQPVERGRGALCWPREGYIIQAALAAVAPAGIDTATTGAGWREDEVEERIAYKQNEPWAGHDSLNIVKLRTAHAGLEHG